MFRPWRVTPPAGPRTTMRLVNGLARTLGFVWIGLLAFLLYPPSGNAALVVQATGYGLAALGLAGWTVLDFAPSAARQRDRLLPAALGLIAVGSGGAAAVAGSGGVALVIFAFVAALAAGGELAIAAALAVTAAGVLATEVCGLAFGSSVASLLGLPAVIASGLIMGRNRGVDRIRAEQAAALLAQREQLQAEQRRGDLLDERARIAREIHDVLAHSLGALAIQIQAARSVLTDRRDIDQASELLAAAQRLAAEGLTETRRAVHALRTDTRPLVDELALVTGSYAQRYQVAVSFSTGGSPRPVPPDATIAMLRVAQEALVNAAKHAPGQAVTVRLGYQDAEVSLEVRNDLAGPAPAGDSPAVRTANLGYGLTGMRERLRILGGTLDAGPAGGQWMVTARLPLSAPENMAS